MASPASTDGKRGWDPLVRLTHWGIALAVVLNGIFLAEAGAVHVWIGYVALGLLMLRLLWGLVGTGKARFASFPPSLPKARAHLRDLLAWRHRDYPSHTPLGAWMAYTLWALIAVVSLTGIAMESDPFPAGVDGGAEHAGWSAYLHDEDDYEDEHGEALEELHEGAATLILVLAALHVAGVGVESRLSGVNLVRKMLPWRQRDG